MANGLRIRCRRNSNSRGFYSPTLRKQEEDLYKRARNGESDKYGPPKDY